MKVIWSPEAVQDRLAIWEYLVSENPQAAIEMDERFAAAVGRLATQPMIGHSGKIRGTRELVPHEHYRMVYEIRSDQIWILALVHTARLWPPVIE